MKNNKNKVSYMINKGFSLIEMAIVLVIVAVLIVGILAGEDVYESSKRIGVVTSIQKYKTAYDQFKEKYYSIPGDMIDAEDVWSTKTKGEGNGDNAIQEMTRDESFLAWQHLALSGFLEGSYLGEDDAEIQLDINIPKGSFTKSGYTMINGGELSDADSIVSDSQNVIVFSRPSINSSAVLHSAVFTPEQAFSIDEKIDDINPAQGQIVAIGEEKASGTSGDYDECAIKGATGTEDDEYKTLEKGRKCILIFYLEPLL